MVFQPEVQVIIVAHPSSGKYFLTSRKVLSSLIPHRVNEISSQLRVHVTSENPLVKSPCPNTGFPPISDTRYTNVNSLITTLSDNFPISLMLDNVTISQNTLKLLEKIGRL